MSNVQFTFSYRSVWQENGIVFRIQGKLAFPNTRQRTNNKHLNIWIQIYRSVTPPLQDIDSWDGLILSSGPVRVLDEPSWLPMGPFRSCFACLLLGFCLRISWSWKYRHAVATPEELSVSHQESTSLCVNSVTPEWSYLCYGSIYVPEIGSRIPACYSCANMLLLCSCNVDHNTPLHFVPSPLP